jgi:hypothetical protein
VRVENKIIAVLFHLYFVTKYDVNCRSIQDFKLGGALKKIAPSRGRRENFGVFRVKNHDFTPKNHIFPILGRSREIFGVFHKQGYL